MSRKAGNTPEQTRNQLLDAAAAEFIAHGFQNSSLRQICVRANATTGALYSNFKDKDELFASVIAPATSYLLKLLRSHYEEELERPLDNVVEVEAGDLQTLRRIITFYYDRKALCDLVLSHRDHPAVIAFFDELMAMMDPQTMLLFEKARGEKGGALALSLDPATVHWFSHLQVDAVFQIISHDVEQDRVEQQIRQMTRFLEAGLWSLFEDKSTA